MSASSLIARERYQEILNQLTPQQLVVVALCLECDLSIGEIAAELGITKQAVSCRLNKAAEAIQRRIPDLAYHGQRRRVYRRPTSEVGLRPRDVAFIEALQALTARGDMATVTTIAREMNTYRNNANRIARRLVELGIVARDKPVGRAVPLTLIGDPDA